MATNRWSSPIDIDQATQAFPASVHDLMPKRDEIPDDFESNRNLYVSWGMKWLYKGLTEADQLTPKPGIDSAKAMAHLQTILRSWEPKHEHKTAAVGYLASLWFEKPTADQVKF